MAGNSIAEDNDSSFTAVPAVSQELLPSQEADDTFLTIQRATFAVSKIYNDLFAKSRADFVSELSELCSTSELRFVRDMMAAVVKRKLGQCNIGNLIERRGTNVKDNLLKDTYNLYSLGEKSIQALPKNMLRCDNRIQDQEVQTDSCLSSTIFASKADVESLKSEFESKLSALREEFISKQCSPSIPVNYLPESLPISSNPSFQVSVDVINSTQSSQMSHQNEAVSTDKPDKEPSRKILFVGDSLLHRMDDKKMKVSDIRSVKLTKRGDSLMSSMSRCRNYVAKHSDEILDVVLLAGTNDLSNKNSCPEDLIKDLDSALTDLTHFSTVQHVFICKIPPRLDFHNINNKVSEFNSLLSERFSDTEEHISVVDTILPEYRYYYVDGLHFSHFGLRKVCSIILSNLYKVLVPSKHKKR